MAGEEGRSEEEDKLEAPKEGEPQPGEPAEGGERRQQPGGEELIGQRVEELPKRGDLSPCPGESPIDEVSDQKGQKETESPDFPPAQEESEDQGDQSQPD